MAQPKIITFKKIEYESLDQFLAAINNAFAIIENSPLFKGIPGTPGLEGDDGVRGERGSKFLFVNTTDFNKVFGSEAQKGSDINIEFLNNKLANFNTKKLLLEAFDVTEFVDKDVFVLTDSSMLIYNVNDNLLVDSGLAFNPENNFINNIDKTIERIVEQKLAENPDLNNISNVFDFYPTLAKNYADDNSALITDTILDTSVYSPYIENYTNRIGIDIDDHNYYGYTDNRFPLDHNGSMVFGSMKRYYQMLMATLSTDSNNTLTSDYAPGNGNIPSLIVMQDTTNNGIYFGFKGKANLKSFGSMYKNDQNEVVIKSDSSKKLNEYSELLIHKDYLKYAKQVYFQDNLTVTKNLEIGGNVDNELINTGIFASDKKLDSLDLGKANAGITRLLSANVELTQFKNIVVVTDTAGRIIKTYSMETMTLADVIDLNLYDLSKVPSSANKIVTSNYINKIIARINSLAKYIDDNYWEKKEWATGVIPSLSLSGTLNVTGNANLTGLITTVKDTSTVNLLGTNTNIESSNIKLSKFKSVVLVTDGNGSIIGTHKISTQVVNPVVNSATGAITGNTPITDVNSILTANYFNTLLKLISDVSTFTLGNYWRKNQFATGDIPALVVKDNLSVQANKFNVGTVLTVDATNTKVNNNQINAGDLTLTKIPSKVLVTDSVGKVLNQYLLVDASSTSAESNKNNTVSTSLVYKHITFSISAPSGTATNNVVKYPVVKQVVDNMNKLVDWTYRVFWRRDQFGTGEIPTILVSTQLTTNGEFTAGKNTNDRNISTSGTNTTIGTSAGKTVHRGNVSFEKYKGGFLYTNATGDLSVTYKPSTILPKVTKVGGTAGTTNNGVFTVTAIDADYSNNAVWKEGSASAVGIYNIENSDTSLINGKHFQWLVYQLMSIRKALTTFYTKPEVDALIDKAVPIGSIMAYNGTVASIPDGWVICDGRVISYQDKAGAVKQYTAPNLVNSFIKALPASQTPGAKDTGVIKLTRNQLPAQSIIGETNLNGAHTHKYHDTYVFEVASVNTSASGNSPDGPRSTKKSRTGGEGNEGWKSRGGVRNTYHGILRDTDISRDNSTTAPHHSHQFSAVLGSGADINIVPKSYGAYYIIKYK